MEVMELTILVEARLHKTLLNTFFHLILHKSKKKYCFTFKQSCLNLCQDANGTKVPKRGYYKILNDTSVNK